VNVGTDVEIELIRLCTEWGWLIDHESADRLHELFLGDATLELSSGVMHGRDEIAAWGMQRLAATRTSRHLMANHHFAQIDEGRAAGTTLVWSIMGDRELLPEQPGTAAPSVVVGEYHDRFQRVEQQWYFESRRFEVIFRGQFLPS
jgi:hypothetical protein